MRKFKEPFAAIVQRERHLERIATMQMQRLQTAHARATNGLNGVELALQSVNTSQPLVANGPIQMSVRPYLAKLRKHREDLRHRIAALAEEVHCGRGRLTKIRRRLAQFDELKAMRFSEWRVEQRQQEEATRQELVLRKVARTDSSGGELE